MHSRGMSAILLSAPKKGIGNCLCGNTCRLERLFTDSLTFLGLEWPWIKIQPFKLDLRFMNVLASSSVSLPVRMLTLLCFFGLYASIRQHLILLTLPDFLLTAEILRHAFRMYIPCVS